MPDRREYHAHIFDGFQDGSLGVCLLFDTRREWARGARGSRGLDDGHGLVWCAGRSYVGAECPKNLDRLLDRMEHIIGMIRGTVCAPAEENAVLLLLDCEAAFAIIRRRVGLNPNMARPR